MTTLHYLLYASDTILAVWFGYALQKYFIKDKVDIKTQLLSVLALFVYVAFSLYSHSIA